MSEKMYTICGSEFNVERRYLSLRKLQLDGADFIMIKYSNPDFPNIELVCTEEMMKVIVFKLVLNKVSGSVYY